MTNAQAAVRQYAAQKAAALASHTMARLRGLPSARTRAKVLEGALGRVSPVLNARVAAAVNSGMTMQAALQSVLTAFFLYQAGERNSGLGDAWEDAQAAADRLAALMESAQSIIDSGINIGLDIYGATRGERPAGEETAAGTLDVRTDLVSSLSLNPAQACRSAGGVWVGGTQAEGGYCNMAAEGGFLDTLPSWALPVGAAAAAAGVYYLYTKGKKGKKAA